MKWFAGLVMLSSLAKPPTLIDQFQKTWDETASYQATFKQTVESKQIGTKEESTGTIFVQKPGKLRWDCETDGSIQILNGKKLISIQVNRRRKTRAVDIYQDISKAVDTKAIQFLAGKAKFQETYKIDSIGNPSTSSSLKLTPKGGDGLETYLAEIDKKSYFLRSLTTESADTRVRMEFSDVKANVVLEASLFDYAPDPKDVVHKQ